MGFPIKYRDGTMAEDEAIDAWVHIINVTTGVDQAHIEYEVYRSEAAYEARRAPMVTLQRVTVRDVEERNEIVTEEVVPGEQHRAVAKVYPGHTKHTDYFGSLHEAGQHPHGAAEAYLQAHKPWEPTDG